MHLQSFLNPLTRVIVPLACISSVYLYLYPIFHGCAFPATDGTLTSAFHDTLGQHVAPYPETLGKTTSLAPFRLLVLADPQLEGDSSLPKPENGLIPKMYSHWRSIMETESSGRVDVVMRAFNEFLTTDVIEAIQGVRKQVDLFGNDYYLAHIFRTLRWWTTPTHITVLGDLIGSQWVTDDEFEWRGWRYWNRVLAGTEKVHDAVIAIEDGQKERTFELDDESWTNRVINIAGNHDIGYAGDISEKRMERFEREFGKANWDVRFNYPFSNDSDSGSTTPSIHMIVLNSLLLDTPALSEELQGKTFEYLNSIINSRARPVEDRSSFVLLLTHLPLFKKEGVCVDPPHFEFFGSGDGGGAFRSGGLKEQYHLSQPASEPGVLEAIYGMKGDVNAPAGGKGRPGLILTGHDHEGCDVWHFISGNTTFDSAKEEEKEAKTVWEAVRWKDAATLTSHTGIREVTLRSMMGDFGGNAGLLSAWFDFEAEEWQYDISMCKLGVQHGWWAIHVVDLVALILVVVNSMVRSKTVIAKPEFATLKKG